MGNGRAKGNHKGRGKGTRERNGAPRSGGNGNAGWPRFGRFTDRCYPSRQLDDLQGAGAAAEALARGEADRPPATAS
jgi:hypothetical protein